MVPPGSITGRVRAKKEICGLAGRLKGTFYAARKKSLKKKFRCSVAIFAKINSHTLKRAGLTNQPGAAVGSKTPGVIGQPPLMASAAIRAIGCA